MAHPDLCHGSPASRKALCVEHRFGYYGAWSALVRAWVIAERGALEEGLNASDTALDEFEGTGAAARMPYYLLSRVYETVTEGFETVDFREAKRLVDLLRASDEVVQQIT
jgi:hypothetical protein